MANSTQATPTLQANIAGTTTTVNLRDWLNTRLSPFLKKAIIESLDSEAQYPLRWLGEHLIQQSIVFEGDPNVAITDHFVYNHDTVTKASQTTATAPPPASEQSQAPVQAPVTGQPQNEAAAAVAPENVQAERNDELMTHDSTANPDESQQIPTSRAANPEGLNGTTQSDATNQGEDTEMSNTT